LSIFSRERERSLSAAEALQATKRMHLPVISFVGEQYSGLSSLTMAQCRNRYEAILGADSEHV
jgi:hypothetical protein